MVKNVVVCLGSLMLICVVTVVLISFATVQICLDLSRGLWTKFTPAIS